MRYWTEAEARAELPRLRILIDIIARAASQSRAAASNGHSVSSNGTGDGVIGDDDPTIDVESAVAELADKGIVLRDTETGLVDFPAITDKGVVYLLCWKRDEDDLGWWHFAEEGFAGRRRLPVPPDL
ncbi:MAG TPA: DUF2203 domain-containing protein [Acidimicrobiales bacterium]